MQEGGQENARVQAIYSLQTHVDWSGSRKCHGTMTAASVAQRRMGFKALRAQKIGQSPCLVSQGFSRRGVTNRSE